MFKSRPTYLMEIDAQVRIPLGIRDRIPELAQLSNDDLVFLLVVSLEERVIGTAVDELFRRGQRLTKRIKGNGQVRKSGAEYMKNRLGEDHATFRVAFKGDHDRAVIAAWAWVARIQTFGEIESVSRLSLRGTDGTFHNWFDQETQEAVASMSPATVARIDEQMDLAPSPA